MAVAAHSPSKLFKRNKGLKKMSKTTLREFTTTNEKGLPAKKTRKKKKGKRG
jgi:hypothetical protein